MKQITRQVTLFSWQEAIAEAQKLHDDVWQYVYDCMRHVNLRPVTVVYLKRKYLKRRNIKIRCTCVFCKVQRICFVCPLNFNNECYLYAQLNYALCRHDRDKCLVLIEKIRGTKLNDNKDDVHIFDLYQLLSQLHPGEVIEIEDTPIRL